jgi:hypothetical protein
MWKIESKEKHIHRNKYDLIQMYMENMFVIVELQYGTWGRKESALTRSKCAASVKVEDIMICIESY